MWTSSEFRIITIDRRISCSPLKVLRYFNISTFTMSQGNDPLLYAKVKKTNEKICENIHIFANEPSLAMYRIQENVRKVVPLAVEIRKNDEATMKGKMQGACFDLEYSLESVQSIIAADASFANTQDMLKNAIFLKQQLKCEEVKRKRDNSNRDSAFKRFSAHIPIEYVVRETTTRVENIIGMNTAAEAQAIQRSHTTL